VLGEWKTRPAMEDHFKKQSFSFVIGAAKVLGRDFEMRIGRTIEKGSYKLVKKMTSLHLTGQNRNIEGM
jgi:hypothetical protein